MGCFGGKQKGMNIFSALGILTDGAAALSSFIQRWGKKTHMAMIMENMMFKSMVSQEFTRIMCIPTMNSNMFIAEVLPFVNYESVEESHFKSPSPVSFRLYPMVLLLAFGSLNICSGLT
jgi:hypothetical protein